MFCSSSLRIPWVSEIQEGRIPTSRVAEAKRYAEQALAIQEEFENSSGNWMTLDILAEIADIEMQAEIAHTYRRLTREAFAAFEGNRYRIDGQHGRLITAIATAAQGDTQAQEAVEEQLPDFEANDWKIATATRRIWAGERDWHALVEEIDNDSALLILRVLETIALQEEASARPMQEEIFAALPALIQEAIQQEDEAALTRALAALVPEKQQEVLAMLPALQEQFEGGEPE